MNKIKELKQNFFSKLEALFDLTKDKSDDELDELLVKDAKNEEQQQLIRDICEDIDTEHQLIQEMMNSNTEAGEWFEQKIEQEARELEPEATDQDIEYLKDALEKQIGTDINDEADAFEKGMELRESIEREASVAENQSETIEREVSADENQQDGKEEKSHE